MKSPNATAMGPYAYRGEDWVSFDDEDIAKKKVRLVCLIYFQRENITCSTGQRYLPNFWHTWKAHSKMEKELISSLNR